MHVSMLCALYAHDDEEEQEGEEKEKEDWVEEREGRERDVPLNFRITANGIPLGTGQFSFFAPNTYPPADSSNS